VTTARDNSFGGLLGGDKRYRRKTGLDKKLFWTDWKQTRQNVQA